MNLSDVTPAYRFGAVCFIVITIVGFSDICRSTIFLYLQTYNLITIIVLLRDRVIRRHSTTAFILSLCVSDFIFSLFCAPVTVAAMLDSELMSGNKILCRLYGSALYVNYGLTTLSISAIAINRYILIVHPNFYRVFYRSAAITFYQVLLIWVGWFGLNAFSFFGIWGEIRPYKKLCKIENKDGTSVENFLYLVGIGMPCIIICVLYVCIYYKVRRQIEKLSPQIVRGSFSQAKERRLTVMTLIIFISFVVCCLPAVVFHLGFHNSPDEWSYTMALTFCGLLTIINPFIYAASNRKYRAAYSRLFADFKIWDRSTPTTKTSTTSEQN